MKPATIDAYHATLAPRDRAICDRLRAALDRGLPEAEARVWHAHPVWFLSGNPIAGYARLKDCTRVLFWSGQDFPTPGLRPSGTFKAAEARFTAAEHVDDALLAGWCRDGRAIQWDYRNIVKRKGRLERLT